MKKFLCFVFLLTLLTMPASASKYYYARQGERIFDIAKRYHARARDLAAANHLDANGAPPETTAETACLLIPAAL